MIYSAGHKAVRGDVLEIVYGDNIRKTIAIGEEENPGLEYACIGKTAGMKFEYLNTSIQIRRISPMDDAVQDRRWIPKVTDFFRLPDDRKSNQYEEVKFGIVNDVTGWKMDALIRELKEKIRAENEISERVLGHNTVGNRTYQQPKWDIDTEVEGCRKIRKNPYGVRLDYLNKKTNEVITIYIGEQRIEDTEGAHVLGWNNTFQQIITSDEDGRTKLSHFQKDAINGIHLESLIHNNTGEFECNGVTYKLQLRRSYSFENLEYGVTYENVYDVQKDAEITDPFLIKVLESKRLQNEMTSIVFSIQEEQRQIMYRPLEQNLVIQGCAGSGKTMILMHRISALLGDVDGLKAENIVILTPNEIFTKSLDSLSRTLEISKVGKISIDRFYEEMIRHYLPGKTFDDEINDEAQVYSFDVLKRAYTEETFDQALRIENDCIHKHQNEFEGEYLKIESLLKRSGLTKTQSANNFAQYLERLTATMARLEQKIKEQSDEIRSIEKQIANDQNRVLESNENARKAEEEMLGLIINVLHDVEVRRSECVYSNSELEKECEKLELKLRKSSTVRNTKGYVDASGIVNLVELALSGEEGLMRLARSYQAAQNEVALLEAEKNKVNPNDIRKQFEVEERLLESRKRLLELYEQVPKESDVMILKDENEIKKEIEEKQRTITQNQSCIKACDNCLTMIKAAKGHTWPDLKQVNGYEIIQDIIESYQAAWETIRIQSGRATNIMNQIDDFQRKLNHLKEKMPSKEENTAMNALNDKIQCCTANSIIEESMQKVCETNGIKTDVICRIQLLFLLQLCYGYFEKQVTNKIALLCIDEAQDVSALEVMLLKKLLGKNIHWNLFGDYMQVSTPYKGQSGKANLWKSVESQINAEIQTIDVNYRNAKEIVNYCNSEFNMNITPMGLNGEVIQESWAMCMEDFVNCLKESKEEYTAAIIVNDSTKFRMYRNELLYGDYEIDESDFSIGTVEEGKIALLDIKRAKGMEFRHVFVDIEEMTQNEKYIAYTRALEKLFVAEPD